MNFKLTYELSAIENAAKWCLEKAGKPGIWVLDGDLGAGKTTLVSAICDQLCVQDAISSPTFALINEYQMPTQEILYHLDLYRVNSEEEIIESGIADLIQSEASCLIEWGSRFPSLLPVNYWQLMITFVSPNERSIILIHHG